MDYPTHQVTYSTGPLARSFDPERWGRRGDGPPPLTRSAGHQTFNNLRVESVLQPDLDVLDGALGIPFDPVKVKYVGVPILCDPPQHVDHVFLGPSALGVLPNPKTDGAKAPHLYRVCPRILVVHAEVQ